MAKKQKVSAKQRAAKIAAAEERQARAEAKKAASDRTKKILTIIVCVILCLALFIPTMALTVLSNG